MASESTEFLRGKVIGLTVVNAALLKGLTSLYTYTSDDLELRFILRDALDVTVPASANISLEHRQGFDEAISEFRAKLLNLL